MRRVLRGLRSLLDPGVWLHPPRLLHCDGFVVDAGSVVTRSLPPGAIAVGAPARVVGHRTGSTEEVPWPWMSLS